MGTKGGKPRLAAAALAAAWVVAAAAPRAWSCASDQDCVAPTPICDGVCVECLFDFDCTAAAPHCNFASESCEGCTSDDQCAPFEGLPACTASGACGQCSATSHAQCAGSTPVCNLATSTCAPCSGNADCSGSGDGPVCLATGACGVETASCGSAPAPVCNQAALSSVRLTRGADPSGNVLLWKWSAGTIAPEDFSDPVFSTTFALCIYRDGQPVAGAQLEPSASFWKETSTGYRFSYPLANPDGILKALLRSGSDDAKITVKGKGMNLDLPSMPLGGSQVVVQLLGDAASGSPCWGAEFPVPYRSDDGVTFKSRSIP